MIYDRIFKYPKYPNYEIRKWSFVGRYGKVLQYAVYYKNKSIGTSQQPLLSLEQSKSIMIQHKDLRDFKKRHNAHLKSRNK